MATSRLHKSAFLRNNMIFLVGALIMGGLNYLYYPVLGRLVDTVTFGEIQALVSLFLQALIFLSVIGMVTVTVVTNYNDVTFRNRVVLELEKLSLFISGGLLLLMLIFQPLLKELLNFDSAWSFAVLGLAIVVTVPLTLRSAYLRGRHCFGLSSMAMIIGAGAKLLLSVLFVIMGFGTIGAMAGIVLGQLLAFIYARQFARKYGLVVEPLKVSLLRLPDLGLIRPELPYAGLVLVGSFTITALYSIDTIVAKRFFDAHTAGLYAGIATVARIIFFVTMPISQVMMTAVKVSQSTIQNHKILVKSGALVAGIGGLVHLCFWLFPNFVIVHLMGSTYLTYANLLPRLSLALLVISILNLFVIYYIALRRFAIGAVAIVGGVLTATLLAFQHQDAQAVVDSILYGSLGMAACLALWVGGSRVKRIRLEGTSNVT